MKINFKQPIVSLETGEPLKNGESVVDLGWAAVQAVMAMYQDERDLAGEEKLARYKLASRIQKAKAGEEQDFSIEEVAKIKMLIGKQFSVSVVGPCWEMLENGEK